MASRLLPCWPSDWWVDRPSPIASLVSIAMICPGKPRLTEDGTIPLWRGVHWRSQPLPWRAGHRGVPSSQVLLTVGWARAVRAGMFLKPNEVGLPPDGWDLTMGYERIYHGFLQPRREQLTWIPNLPPVLGPVVDRALELLGRGEIRQGVRYTVDPP